MASENRRTKVCKKCGRELPLKKFNKIYGKNWMTTCKECVAAARMKTCYENGLKLYRSDKSMRIKREYKKIHPSRLLPKKVSGIAHIKRDEKFVRLLDYKDTWISNYGRLIEKRDGVYHLLKASHLKSDKEYYYTLDKNVYFKTKKEWGYRRQKVRASVLVIQAFIVDYDMQNNTMCWHEGNDHKDNYYKNLYPVNEFQYTAIQELYEKQGTVSQDEIMDIVNAVEYKAENWNPWYFRRSYEGVGYIGTDDVDYSSDEYFRWRNMIQRCYSKKIHSYKPYYQGISVCEEWKNFSNFRIWYRDHMIPGAKMDLDKDLLCMGNKVYSPETCVFITHYLNTVFESRGIENNIQRNDEGTYSASMLVLNKRVDLGVFDSEEEARKGIESGRSRYIIDLAEKCKGKVPDCVYDAMMSWKMEVA